MLIVGFPGTELDAEWCDRLMHPAIAGVILFRRNIENREQVRALCAQLRALRDPRLLIAVDQEGGRVRRLLDEDLPALATLQGEASVVEHARQMVAQTWAHGIDLSFTPVLDLCGNSEVIGDRAFAADPVPVATLGCAYIRAMQQAGMAACAKHFPGHGTAHADTHVAEAIDDRDLAALLATDLIPFRAAIDAGVAMIMTAHVRYPAVDTEPASLSRRWVGEILRQQLGFDGLVVCDDLSMAAVRARGLSRALDMALEAGTDLALLCEPDDVVDLLDQEPALAAAGRIALPYGDFDGLAA